MMDWMGMLQNMDEEQAEMILDQLDDEDIQQAVEWVADEFVVPHLNDIRERAEGDPDYMDVREYFESMSEAEREREFYDTLDELVATLIQCREQPREGFRNLKAFLRDPFTVEALLLIFENERHIDPEYTDQLKVFGAEHLKWVGALTLPEMYDDSEVEGVLEKMDIDPDNTHGGAKPGGST